MGRAPRECEHDIYGINSGHGLPGPLLSVSGGALSLTAASLVPVTPVNPGAASHQPIQLGLT